MTRPCRAAVVSMLQYASSTQRPTAPRARSAACSWRVCQPISSVMMTMRVVMGLPSCFLQPEPLQQPHLWRTAVPGVAAVDVADPHLGRCEQRAVDLVEVVVDLL